MRRAAAVTTAARGAKRAERRRRVTTRTVRRSPRRVKSAGMITFTSGNRASRELQLSRGPGNAREVTQSGRCDQVELALTGSSRRTGARVAASRSSRSAALEPASCSAISRWTRPAAALNDGSCGTRRTAAVIADGFGRVVPQPQPDAAPLDPRAVLALLLRGPGLHDRHAVASASVTPGVAAVRDEHRRRGRAARRTGRTA